MLVNMPIAITETVSNNTEIKKEVKSKSSSAAKPRKRFVGSKAGPSSKRPYHTDVAKQIKSEILKESQLNDEIKQIQSKY